MKELQEFFKDIKRIADAMEKIVADNNEANVFINKTLNEVKNVVDNCESVSEIKGTSAVQEVEPVPVKNVQTAPIPTAIPVSNVTQSYTQDQLAVAMGRAIDMGKMTEMQNILKCFNVQSLMELTPDRYNDLALKLREIGVEV